MNSPMKHFFTISGRKRSLPRRFVYCCGSLLKDVQLADIFADSKTFIDKKLKSSVHEVLMNYEKMVNMFGKYRPTEEALREFVLDNFEDSKELEIWTPPDWEPNPHILNRIKDKNLQKWAIEINNQWTYLGRKMVSDVKQNPHLYSLISVPEGFLISSEKLKELYYWDSYWIVNGILKCNMWDTAKDIIKNFLYLVEKYGYVPSGTRIYYKHRSQPPLLTMMMESYYNHTKDLNFLKENISILEKEMKYWKKHRSVIIRKKGFEYQMFQYKVKTKGPRPEHYKDDVRSGFLADSGEELENHFTALKSAAESGWNLSTRWFLHRGYNHGDRSCISTHSIVPVDLNAIIHRNYVLFSKWHQILGDKALAKKYQWESENLLKSMEVVLWNENVGIWLDYDLENNKQRDYFYISNLVPLWTKSYKQNTEKLSKQVLKYLTQNKINNFIGGVPASLEDSGELWDYPNCWPPLQAFLIQGLDKLGDQTASSLALMLANKFINTCYKDFKIHQATLQFYDCLGQGNGNNELTTQGHAWTNGVIFELLDRWGDKLYVPQEEIAKTIIINKNEIGIQNKV